MKKYLGIFVFLSAITIFVFQILPARANREHLDWKIAIILKAINLYSPNYKEMEPEEVRRRINNGIVKSQIRKPKVYHIDNIIADQNQTRIPLRIYYPRPVPPLGHLDSLPPVIVFYHGGGFLQGSLDTHDNVCRRLVRESRAIVVSVDYRLAPENPFPAAVVDAYNSFLWVSEHIHQIGGDPENLIVAGDSAGGNLAAVVTHLARDKNGPKISLQILIYPAVDLTGSQMSHSYARYGEGYFLTLDKLMWLRSLYVPQKEDQISPLASPILSKNFANLPPAIIIGAGFDPLRDQGADYAHKLQDAGVSVQYYLYPDVIHGFVNMGFLNQSRDAIRKISASVYPKPSSITRLSSQVTVFPLFFRENNWPIISQIESENPFSGVPHRIPQNSHCPP